MENIINYVRLRKDISFETAPFNNVDALVLSILSYINWENIINDEKVNLISSCSEYFKKYTKEEIDRQYIFSIRTPILAKEIIQSKRYENISMMHYKNVYDENEVIQFSAVTFVLPDESLFISYRGTDGSINGWKENMQMTYKSNLSCHDLACQYAKEIFETIEEKTYFFGLFKKMEYPKIYLGGHSKGGNLAMYAALNEGFIKSYITQVYAFDAPGFREDLWLGKINDPILEKITNYKPKDSIIGCLLSHYEKSKILDAVDTGLTQHDSFNWSVDVNDFYYVDSLTEQSKEALDYIDRILMSKSDEDKKSYIDTLFSVIDKLEIKSLSDLTELGLRQGISGLLELRQMTSEERKFLFEVINFLRIQTISLIKVGKSR